MKIKMLSIAALTAFLTACGGTEETKTVEYYSQNQTDRDAKLQECANNPGDLANTPNCKNAEAAAVKASAGEYDPNPWGDSNPWGDTNGTSKKE